MSDESRVWAQKWERTRYGSKRCRTRRSDTRLVGTLLQNRRRRVAATSGLRKPRAVTETRGCSASLARGEKRADPASKQQDAKNGGNRLDHNSHRPLGRRAPQPGQQARDSTERPANGQQR